MRTVDIGSYFVVYNLVIGILLMLSSEKLGAFAGRLAPSNAATLTRYTRLGVLTFGAAVAVLSGTIYVVFHLLRIGL